MNTVITTADLTMADGAATALDRVTTAADLPSGCKRLYQAATGMPSLAAFCFQARFVSVLIPDQYQTTTRFQKLVLSEATGDEYL